MSSGAVHFRSRMPTRANTKSAQATGMAVIEHLNAGGFLN
jgi:hypothetical protein